MTAIVKLLGGVRATIFAGIALALLVALGITAWRLNNAQTARDDAEAAVAAFNATQQANLDTIDQLTKRLAALAEQRKVELKASAKAIAKVDAVAEKVDAENARLNDQLAALYARDKAAQTWGETGVDANVLANLPGGKK